MSFRKCPRVLIHWTASILLSVIQFRKCNHVQIIETVSLALAMGDDTLPMTPDTTTTTTTVLVQLGQAGSANYTLQVIMQLTYASSYMFTPMLLARPTMCYIRLVNFIFLLKFTFIFATGYSFGSALGRL